MTAIIALDYMGRFLDEKIVLEVPDITPGNGLSILMQGISLLLKMPYTA